MTSPLRRFLAALLLLSAAFTPRRASADGMVIAIVAEMPAAGRIREAVIAGLPQGIKVVDKKRFRAALTAAGVTKAIEGLDAKTVANVRRAASATGAEAVFIVRARAEKKDRTVRILVVDLVAPTGLPITLRLPPKASDKDEADLAAILADALKPYGPPPPHEPEKPVSLPLAAAPLPSAKPPVIAPPATPPVITPVPPTAAQLAGTSLLDIALGGELVGRHSRYDNGIAPAARTYDLTLTPAARVYGNLTPFGRIPDRIFDIGLSYDYARTFLKRSDFGGAPRRAAPTSWALGLRARFHPPFHPPFKNYDPAFIAGVTVQYAFSSFATVGPPNAELPPVTYRAFRLAGDIRIPLGKLSLLLTLAYRALLAPDSTSTRFYAAHGFGLDGELGAGFMVVPHVEIRALARYSRFALALTQPPGASVGEGHAMDEHYSAGASAAFIF